MAIFVPVWAQFISSIFKISAVTLPDTFQVFFSLTGVIILIFTMISAIKSMLNDILNDFVNKDSNRYKRLANILEDISFEIDI